MVNYVITQVKIYWNLLINFLFFGNFSGLCLNRKLVLTRVAFLAASSLGHSVLHSQQSIQLKHGHPPRKHLWFALEKYVLQFVRSLFSKFSSKLLITFLLPSHCSPHGHFSRSDSYRAKQLDMQSWSLMHSPVHFVKFSIAACSH